MSNRVTAHQLCLESPNTVWSRWARPSRVRDASPGTSFDYVAPADVWSPAVGACLSLITACEDSQSTRRHVSLALLAVWRLARSHHYATSEPVLFNTWFIRM